MKIQVTHYHPHRINIQIILANGDLSEDHIMCDVHEADAFLLGFEVARRAINRLVQELPIEHQTIRAKTIKAN